MSSDTQGSPQGNYGNYDPTQPVQYPYGSGGTTQYGGYPANPYGMPPPPPPRFPQRTNRWLILLIVVLIFVVVLSVSGFVWAITRATATTGTSSTPTTTIPSSTVPPSVVTTQPVVLTTPVTQPTPTQAPSTLRPTGNFPTGSIEHPFGNCIGVEVIPHHDPTLGVDWNPDADYQVNGQPVAMQEWSNAKPGSQNQPLYKLYLPNGFVDSSGHKIVFPSGGGMIVVFAKGCENAAQQWYASDSTPNSATADQLVSIGNAREV